MKALFSTLIVLAMASPLCADTVLFSENFEGGTAGNSIAGWNGWSGDASMVISSTVIDSGQSAGNGLGAVGWPPGVMKGFTYAPSSSEAYTLTAVLSAPDTGGAYGEVGIGDDSVVNAGVGTANKGVVAWIGYDRIVFDAAKQVEGEPIARIKIAPQPGEPLDIKMVLSNSWNEFYYRNHGDTDWTDAGGFAAVDSLADYSKVAMIGHFSSTAVIAGGVDTIQVSVGPAPVPEPSSLMITCAGLIGLLAYAWRKRK
jgi:hypothetical protein